MRNAQRCLPIFLALSCALPSVLSAATVGFTNKKSVGTGYTTPFQHLDLNNDGREDLVAAYIPPMGGYASFLVQLSNGDGTYAKQALYNVPNSENAYILALATGDFNNDGKADVAVFSSDDNLYVWLNDGAGALTLSSTITPFPNSQSSYPQPVVADFNHDGKQDIAYSLSGQIYTLLGNGNAGFTFGPVTPVADNGNPLLLGDFDGDGKIDVAVETDHSTNGTIAVLYGDNTGHFPGNINISADTSGPVSAGDVNSDGRMDLISVAAGPALVKHVSVLYGNVARTFINRTTIPTTHCSVGDVTVADFDGNGYNDLLIRERDCATNTGPSYIGLLTRNSNSSYNSEQTIYTEPSSGGLYYGLQYAFPLRADLNSKPDVLVGQCTASECSGFQLLDLLNTTVSSGFPSCAPPNSLEGINICSPASATVTSPVPFAVGAAGPIIMRDVEVWVDGNKLAEQSGGFSNYTFLNQSLSLSAGTHHVDVYALGWDQFAQRKSLNLTVK